MVGLNQISSSRQVPKVVTPPKCRFWKTIIGKTTTFDKVEFLRIGRSGPCVYVDGFDLLIFRASLLTRGRTRSGKKGRVAATSR